MITEFEMALVAYLNTNIDPPFAGNVERSDGGKVTVTNNPQVRVSVIQAVTALREMGTKKPLLVPGSNDYRRVSRLKCDVVIDLYATNTAKREQILNGVELIHYLLDTPTIKNGTELEGGPDPGFVIQSLTIEKATIPLKINLAGVDSGQVHLEVTGWFWPVGVPGQEGVEIGAVRIRGITFEVSIEQGGPLIAGGPMVDFVVGLEATGPIVLTDGEVESDPSFGSLYCFLRTPDGSAAQGFLGGGIDAGDGARLVPVSDSTATVSYTPPGNEVQEELVIGLDDGNSNKSIDIGSLILKIGNP